MEPPEDPYIVRNIFNVGGKDKSPFGTAGCMDSFRVAACDLVEDYRGERRTLGDVIVPQSEAPESFFVPKGKLEKWRYLNGSKSEEHTKKTPDGTKFTYRYSEGSMAFPDLLENTSRTILAGEGGAGASRFKHIGEIDGRYRRLVPDELDQLQGSPKGWINNGMSDGYRAFCMGNALVVGIPHLIGTELSKRIGLRK